MAMMSVTRVALMAVVCMGLSAMPALANHPSVVGKWEGSCVRKFDYNYNCVKKGHVAAQAFYLDISKSGKENYKFVERADPAIVTGGAKLNGYTTTYTFPINGDPTKGATVVDLDEIYNSFSLYLQRIGGHDILTYAFILDAAEGALPTTLFPPLFCDPNVVYGPGEGKKANKVCTLFRKK